MLKQYSLPLRERVDQTLANWTLPSESVAPKLTEAMRYSLFNGGKRIRPILAYASAQAVNSQPFSVLTDAAAAAVECIHAYSLVHDDLPAMDDDDLRRGKPTCHIQFDYPTAILAGDALQTLAFEKLAIYGAESPQSALKILADLSLASGDKGMVGGQMIDLLAEGQADALDITELEKIHRHKTGALIRAAVSIGATSANASAEQLRQLDIYANAIGLAFQVQDDIIDVTSDTQTLGKQQGADIALGKSTYVSLLGLEAAQAKAESLKNQALEALAGFDLAADPLRWIARYIVERNT